MRLVPIFLATLVVCACSGAPTPAPRPASDEPAARRRADLADQCEQQPGKPPPKPLERRYTGVAAKARCQREVYTIMGGLTHFLGVKCNHCHVEPDYALMTHRKRVANWMARELVPRLQKRGGGEVWCNDCHVVNGKGRAKILGNPRDQRWAMQWMMTHLVAEQERTDGGVLGCADCHGSSPGTPGFRGKLILQELPGWKQPAKPVSERD